MAFDLENSIQQGINVDPITNDKQIGGNNIEVQLGDPDGYGTFKVLKPNNDAVAEIDSDGYLSIAGNAEIHGGNVLVDGQINTEFVTLKDGTTKSSVFLLDQDPNGTIIGTKGSIGLNNNDGYLYINRDGTTEWSRIPIASEVSGASTFTQRGFLDISGGFLNGTVKVNYDGLTPALDYKHNSFSKATWTMQVPADWDGLSDIVIELFWSPENSGAGNIVWKLEYKAVALTEIVSSAANLDTYTQAAGGATNVLQNTGSNLSISSANLQSSDAMIVVAVERDGKNAADTYNGSAQIHSIQYSYMAKNIVS